MKFLKLQGSPAWAWGLAGLILCGFAVIFVFQRPPTSMTLEANDHDAAVRLDAAATHIFAPNSCLQLVWNIQNINAVYLDGQGIAGEGFRTYCPLAQQINFRVIFRDETEKNYSIPLHFTITEPLFFVPFALGLICLYLALHRLARGGQPEPASTTLPQEIKALTSLRAIAALLVFLHHFYQPGPDASHWFEAVMIQGHIGVTIFFVLSGFLITLRYRSEFYSGATPRTIFRYMTKRIARIYPLYFMVIFSVLSFNYSLLNTEALIVFTLTQSLFVNVAFYFVPTAWSLSVEEMFYVTALCVYTLLGYVQRKFSLNRLQTMLASLTCLACFVFVFLLVGFLIYAWANTWTDNPYQFMQNYSHVVRYTIFGRFFDFALGMGLAILYQQGYLGFLVNHAHRSLLVATGAMVAIVVFQNMMHIEGGWLVFAAWLWDYWIAIAAAILIVALINPKSPLARLMSFGLFVYLGRISYALYLIQFTRLVLVAHEFSNPFQSNPFLATLVLYISMNVVAAIFYELIEKSGRERLLTAANWLELKLFRSKTAPPEIPLPSEAA